MMIGSEAKRAILGAVAGFLYGAVLVFLSLFAAGGGHGTNISLFLSLAPVSALFLVPDVGAGRDWSLYAVLYGGAILWAALGSLAALAGSGKRRLAMGLLVLQYASGLALLAVTGISIRGLNGTIPEGFIAWAPVYLAGQAALWWQIGRGPRLRPTA